MPPRLGACQPGTPLGSEKSNRPIWDTFPIREEVGDSASHSTI